MRHFDNHPNSRGFRHSSRQLKHGESIPKLPSLLDQLAACKWTYLRTDEEECGNDRFEESFDFEDDDE